MHKFASCNHRLLPASAININPFSNATLYGKGVFTTLAIYHSKPFLWEKHWRRLNENAERIGIDLAAFNASQVFSALKEIIEKNNCSNARARITFFDESASKIWPSESENKTSLLIQTADLRKRKENLSVCVSPYPINSNSPLAGIKSCNYLEQMLALEDAKNNGFDEAIRFNERNEVVSFCLANIFWLEYGNDKLFTPSLETGCLAGTIRELILENFEVFEVKKEINELFRDVEAMFITSSGKRIAQITNIDGARSKTNAHRIKDLIEEVVGQNIY